jgi:DNA replication protein DnaC
MVGMTEEDKKAELDRLDIETYNEKEGDMDLIDGIHCDICKNKGWIKVLVDGCVKVRQCTCIGRRQSCMDAKNSGLGKYLAKDQDDYIVTEEWQANAFDKMNNFIERHSKDNVWFMALGQSGCGKTLICSIIANYLLFVAKRKVMYLTWTDFIGKLKRDVMGDKTNEVSAYLDKVKKVDVLFIDEMLKKYNDTDLKYLIEIINYRYANDLKTIITSENVFDKLIDIDEATFGRAIEKCEGFSINIPKDRKKNYRLKGIGR